MDTLNPSALLAHINPSSSPPSLGRDIFASHVARKEIDFEQYLDHNALWVADHAGEYSLVLYRPMTESLQAYIDRRAAGTVGYDPATAAHLGDWFVSVFRSREENDMNISTFLWARKRCLRLGMEAQARALHEAIEEFQRLQFPYYLFEKTLRVKALDSIARDRGEGK